MRKLLIALVFMFASSAAMPAADTSACHGQFPNLFTDVCWDCMFPVRLMGAVTIDPGNQEDYNSGDIPNLCVCNNSMGIPTAGFHTAFWEFARQAEVTRTPYCMVSLGIQLDVSINADQRGANSYENTQTDRASKMVFRQAHWYINPAMGLMEIALDSKCLEPKGFDITYMSEIDPTHSDEEMERILNPESYLFGNIAAQLACAADAVSAACSFGINTLYWCGGSQGPVIPMVGYIDAAYGGVQASSLMVHRLDAKLHRMLSEPSTAGPTGMCGSSGTFQINLDKRERKYSMLLPSSQSSVDNNSYGATGSLPCMNGRCCQPYGRTTAIWGSGRETPITGEDFAYAIFRKRDCCQ